jgi:hypothetical protein
MLLVTENSSLDRHSSQAADLATKCRRKFLRAFPRGFTDDKYLTWERNYKLRTHREWQKGLGQSESSTLLRYQHFMDIAMRALRIESRTHLLFSFEKMALRDALKIPSGAKSFANGLHDFLYGTGSCEDRFEKWIMTVESLPRKQSRVLTWPIVTIFGFIAQPESHIYLKPKVTKIAAQRYGFAFDYRSRPNWRTYSSLLEFARVIRKDLSRSASHAASRFSHGQLRPRDMIDIQSFIWVQGSDEYADWQ